MMVNLLIAALVNWFIVAELVKSSPATAGELALGNRHNHHPNSQQNHHQNHQQNHQQNHHYKHHHKFIIIADSAPAKPGKLALRNHHNHPSQNHDKIHHYKHPYNHIVLVLCPLVCLAFPIHHGLSELRQAKTYLPRAISQRDHLLESLRFAEKCCKQNYTLLSVFHIKECSFDGSAR